jgi:nucleolar MIF4G domain-containing protein 1
VLKDCVMAACSNPSQLMTTLIPTYAAVIAALHATKGVVVGAFITETLATSLHKDLMSQRKSQSSSGHEYISSKLPSNALMLLVYLYNLRIIHHTLIMDVMNLLAGLSPNEGGGDGDEENNVTATSITELEAELMVLIVDHCGPQLRSDDPLGIKNVILSVQKRVNQLQSQAHTQGGDQSQIGSGRLRFLLEALTDLKNNKSRRTQAANGDVVKALRKWLGSIKTQILGAGNGTGDTCLRVTFSDLLDADKRGRWWRTGASWVGNSGGDEDAKEKERNAKTASIIPVTNSSEEAQLLQLAQKMRFNTGVRKGIFVVLMSSRDVEDAFERLQRLDLKGKQDREVVRVITECCAQERNYNQFYAELAALLCKYNRQYKTTFQFTFWDHFKVFSEDKGSSDSSDTRTQNRRAVNLARMLAHLVCAFCLPLSVVKPIDTTDLNAKLVLFLATFFMALFSAKVRH